VQQPKVSVLIPFYNLEKYVDETLESVFTQKTDFAFEVLCADDGSRDGTVEKIKAWARRYPDRLRWFVMDREEKASAAAARISRSGAVRRRLFEEAQGEYICFLDGDDLFNDPTKLQKQADILDADTEKNYVACGHNGCYYWAETGETRPIEKPLRACGLTAQEYWSFLYVSTDALLFRNLRLQGIDPFDTPLTMDDNFLTFQMLQYGGLYYLPDCMFYYRQVPNSTWHRWTPLQRDLANATIYYQQRAVTRKFDAAGSVRFIREFEALFAARKDPRLAEEAAFYLDTLRAWKAGRLLRIVNYRTGSLFDRILCEIENPVCHFIARVNRKLIWQPKVRALLEESRLWQEQGR